MLTQDKSKLLSETEFVEVKMNPDIEKLTEGYKKLLYIDIKRKHIYWEILTEDMRAIKKEDMETKEEIYKWKFTDKKLGKWLFDNLGPAKIIEVLGKHKYTELKNRSMFSDSTLRTIHLNVMNDAYVNFDEFLSSVVDLINLKSIQIFDGRFMKHFRTSENLD